MKKILPIISIIAAVAVIIVIINVIPGSSERRRGDVKMEDISLEKSTTDDTDIKKQGDSNADDRVLNCGEGTVLEDGECVPEALDAIPDEYGRSVGVGCQIYSGCNGSTVCLEEGLEDISTTCEALPEYACYKESTARCEMQSSGICGWTETEELRSCIELKTSIHFAGDGWPVDWVTWNDSINGVSVEKFGPIVSETDYIVILTPSLGEYLPSSADCVGDSEIMRCEVGDDLEIEADFQKYSDFY